MPVLHNWGLFARSHALCLCCSFLRRLAHSSTGFVGLIKATIRTNQMRQLSNAMGDQGGSWNTRPLQGFFLGTAALLRDDQVLLAMICILALHLYRLQPLWKATRARVRCKHMYKCMLARTQTYTYTSSQELAESNRPSRRKTPSSVRYKKQEAAVLGQG